LGWLSKSQEGHNLWLLRERSVINTCCIDQRATTYVKCVPHYHDFPNKKCCPTGFPAPKVLRGIWASCLFSVALFGVLCFKLRQNWGFSKLEVASRDEEMG
jgi:hypothetical protein